MNNFGVIEIASTTTKSTPGWAYVPDTGPALPAAVQPSNRKRAARNQPALTLSDLSAREETRVRKELEVLDRDNQRDVSIPIPPKPGGASRAQNKHTPNVRKILQSQKTFANHLADYQAMLALAESNPAAAAALNAAQTKPSTPAATASKSASPAPSAPASTGGSKRSAAAAKRAAAKEKQEQDRKKARQTPKTEPPPPQPPPPPPPQTKTKPEPDAQSAPQQLQQQQDTPDVEMADHDPASGGAPRPRDDPSRPQSEPHPRTYPRESAILPPYARPPPAPHPGDADPLLVSYVPPFPADDELRALMTAPPLSYLEARAVWPPPPHEGAGDGDGSSPGAPGAPGARYPVRVFCAVCGYWGRVKCMKCGTRVCALDCLETHREECVTRYGL